MLVFDAGANNQTRKLNALPPPMKYQCMNKQIKL
jgi:hypothetical protein